jgi:hypothetical protein
MRIWEVRRIPHQSISRKNAEAQRTRLTQPEITDRLAQDTSAQILRHTVSLLTANLSPPSFHFALSLATDKSVLTGSDGFRQH